MEQNEIKLEDYSLYVASGKNGIYWIPRKKTEGTEGTEPIQPNLQEKQLLLSIIEEVYVRMRLDLQRHGIMHAPI